jgi:small-conductance mechanosensitive channel
MGAQVSRFLCAALLALLLAVAPGGVAAQDSPLPAEWQADATRAEEVLESERTATETLESLRTEIAAWRTEFLALQSANQSRIETLRGQIAALGPVPEEGTAETPEIAARRAELTEQLARLQAPGLAAVEAYSRADGIIREIDATIRARQADELLRLFPTPLDPSNWPAAFAVLTKGLETLWGETTAAWANPAKRTELRNHLPVIILYLVIAVGLLARGPALFQSLGDRLRLGGSEPARRLGAVALSLGQVVLPVGGMFLLVLAVEATEMAGPRTGALLSALPPAALLVFMARWLNLHLFTGTVAAAPIVPGAPPATARLLVNSLGLLLAAEILRIAFTTEVRPPLSMAAQSVWGGPVVILASIFLHRLGGLLRQAYRSGQEEGEALLFRNRIGALIGTVTVAVAILGPLLAVVGYVPAANGLVWPMILSLGLLGLLLLAQRVVADGYCVIIGDVEEGSDALVPVLIGFGLFLVAIPVFALIWGARAADLMEIWTRVQEGVTIGETRISPAVFLTFAVIFAVGYMATRLLQGALRASILPRTRMDKGGQNAVASFVGYLGIFLAALTAISTAGIDLSSLAIIAGALSVGIGFGLQNVVSNFVSGIILLIERPVGEGDWIEVGGKMGIVKAISVRSTRVETFDKTELIVPNADLVSSVVTNWTRANLAGRIIVKVGVAYGSDTRKVERILKEIAEAHPLVTVNPPPSVFFSGFGADSLDFEIRAILSDVNFSLGAASDINHEIARRFAEEGVEIPFAQRDINIRNAEAFRGLLVTPRKEPDA